jgi:hypothetical protein
VLATGLGCIVGRAGLWAGLGLIHLQASKPVDWASLFKFARYPSQRCGAAAQCLQAQLAASFGSTVAALASAWNCECSLRFCWEARSKQGCEEHGQA